jgi:hypothetical protein
VGEFNRVLAIVAATAPSSPESAEVVIYCIFFRTAQTLLHHPPSTTHHTAKDKSNVTTHLPPAHALQRYHIRRTKVQSIYKKYTKSTQKVHKKYTKVHKTDQTDGVPGQPLTTTRPTFLPSQKTFVTLPAATITALTFCRLPGSLQKKKIEKRDKISSNRSVPVPHAHWPYSLILYLTRSSRNRWPGFACFIPLVLVVSPASVDPSRFLCALLTLILDRTSLPAQTPAIEAQHLRIILPHCRTTR